MKPVNKQDFTKVVNSYELANLNTDDGISKTGRKKQMLALQKLGESLFGLPAHELDDLPLSERFRNALDALQTITSRRANKRQKQLIGKLMRSEDCEAVIARIHQREEEAKKAASQHLQAERWRQRLVQGDSTDVDSFCHIRPDVDRDRLVHLISQAKNKDGNRHKQHYKTLLQMLKAIL